MALLEELTIKLKADSTEFANGLQKAKGELDKTVQATDALKSRMETATDASNKFAVAFLAVAAATGAMALKMVVLSGQLEQTRIAFTTMLGSAGAADIKIRELFQFAKVTPFQIKDVVLGARQLTAYGFEAAKLIPTLTAIGDAAAGLGLSGEGLERIIVALGQMKARGMISGEEMRQLGQAGIPAWQLLAEIVGKSIPEAMQAAENRLIPIEGTLDALITKIGERFKNLMSMQSKTLLGLWSNLQDQITLTSYGIGEAITKAFDLKPRLASLIDEMAKITSVLETGGIKGVLDKLIPPEVLAMVPALAGAITGMLVPALWSMSAAIIASMGALAPFAAAGAALALAWSQNWFGMRDAVKSATQAMTIDISQLTEFMSGKVKTINENAMVMGQTWMIVHGTVQVALNLMGSLIGRHMSEHQQTIKTALVEIRSAFDREYAAIQMKSKETWEAAKRDIEWMRNLTTEYKAEIAKPDTRTWEQQFAASNADIIAETKKMVAEEEEIAKAHTQFVYDQGKIESEFLNNRLAEQKKIDDKAITEGKRTQEELSNLARDYSRDLANAMQDFVRRSEEMAAENAARVADAEAEFADQMTKLEADLAEAKIKENADYQDRIKDAIDKSNEAKAKAEEDLHDKLVAETTRYQKAQEDAETSYYERLGKIEDDYGKARTDAETDTHKRITDLRIKESDQENTLAQEYNDKAQAARDKELDEEAKVTEKLGDEIKKRADALMDWVGLFDKVPEAAKVTGAELIENLEKQVGAFAAWQANIELLRAREGPAGLMESLQGMGPKASGQIAALAAMGVGQWGQFTRLWQEKRGAAEAEAGAGAGGLRSEAVGQIAKLRSELTTTYNALKDEHLAKLAELRRLHVVQLLALVVDHLNLVEKLRVDHDAKIAQLDADNRIALYRLYVAHIAIVDQIKVDHIKKIEDLGKDHLKTLDKLLVDHDKRMVDLLKAHDKRQGEMQVEHTKRMAKLETDHNRDMLKLIQTHTDRMADLEQAHKDKLDDILGSHNTTMDAMNTEAQTRLGGTLYNTWHAVIDKLKGEIGGLPQAVQDSVDAAIATAQNAIANAGLGGGQEPSGTIEAKILATQMGLMLPGAGRLGTWAEGEASWEAAQIARAGLANVAQGQLQAIRAQIINLQLDLAEAMAAGASNDIISGITDQLRRLQDIARQYARTYQTYGGGVSAQVGGVVLKEMMVRVHPQEVIAPLSRLPDILAQVSAMRGGGTTDNRQSVTVYQTTKPMSPVEAREQYIRAMRSLRYEAG